MQQTEKYQFKLIDPADDFSPAPLNDNMEKVEQELENLESSLTAAIGSGGSTARMAWGTYTGTGTYGQSNPMSLTFGFRPLVVWVCNTTKQFALTPMMLTRPSTYTTFDPGANGAKPNMVTWQEKGVEWYTYGGGTAREQANTSGDSYCWVALGY